MTPVNIMWLKRRVLSTSMKNKVLSDEWLIQIADELGLKIKTVEIR